MFVLKILLLISAFGCAYSFLGNLTISPKGMTFSFNKQKAERKFLKNVGEKRFIDYVTRKWLNYWIPKPPIKRKFPLTKFKDKTLEWWNLIHNYIAPKKKGRRPRRRKCRKGNCKKRDLLRSSQTFKQLVLSRQKRQECSNIPQPPFLRRREWRQMSQADRNSFITAFNALADTNAPGTSVSMHNTFVEQHRAENSPSSHNGAGFLPWHREYLWRFSNAMRRMGYTGGGIPYWDNAADVELPNPADSAVWTTTQFGPSSSLVNQPFDSIRALDECELQGSNILRRDMKIGIAAQALMMDRNIIQTILDKQNYQDLTKGWDVFFEEQHERMLLLLGDQTTSQMANSNCAPTDPVYWLHCVFMDEIWERYRNTRQDFVEREIEYPQTNLVGPNPEVNPRRHGYRAQMRPFFGLINAHGISNHYTSYYYDYSRPPSDINCNNHGDCTGSQGSMLWCRQNRCRGQIRVGGVCNPNWPDIQCHCPIGNPNCNSQNNCEC